MEFFQRGGTVAWSSSCSRNAHDKAVLFDARIRGSTRPRSLLEVGYLALLGGERNEQARKEYFVGRPGRSLCSRNPDNETVVVRRVQFGTKPGRLETKHRFLAKLRFDPAEPTALLYKKTADGYELEGAMYTAPTPEEIWTH